MKKGAMSIETLVIIILALLVLVIVAAAFSGGMSELLKKLGIIAETTGEMSLSQAKTNCDNICLTSPQAFCTTSYITTESGPVNCKGITTCPTANCGAI